MVTNTRRTQRGESSLSRDRIIDTAIELLDASGEAGLTFRALAERLSTGAGAIYWHVADKDDLVGAACDAVVAATLAEAPAGAPAGEAIRAIGLGLFDALDRHPWIGAALMRSPGKMPMVRIMEGIGREVQALGVPPDALWTGASALLHYVLGVAGQNAANAQYARAHALVREDFLAEVAGQWSALDAHAFPFTRAAAARLPQHDDRADFLAGIDLIVAGIGAARPA
jgi:AcrR family transcriptional regulator